MGMKATRLAPVWGGKYPLPSSLDREKRDRNLRQAIVNHLYRGNGPAVSYCRTELLAKIGDLTLVADPVNNLQSFHKEHLLRITDLFKTNQNPIETSGQLGDLRQALVISAFRLATTVKRGNLALAIGGSAGNGVHTFLTDIDYVVIPYSGEDQAAVKNVQKMMIRILHSINLEVDWGMEDKYFQAMTFSELEREYVPITKMGVDDPLEAVKRGMCDTFFRFIMDIKIADICRKDDESEVLQIEYETCLARLQDVLVYSRPDYIRSLSADRFLASLPVATATVLAKPRDIKSVPLRALYFALIAGRARLGIRSSDFWEVLDQLQLNGLLAAEEKTRAKQALRLFISLRHLIGFSLVDADDSVTLHDWVVDKLAALLGEERAVLIKIINEGQAELVAIAKKIFDRLNR